MARIILDNDIIVIAVDDKNNKILMLSVSLCNQIQNHTQKNEHTKRINEKANQLVELELHCYTFHTSFSFSIYYTHSLNLAASLSCKTFPYLSQPVSANAAPHQY